MSKPRSVSRIIVIALLAIITLLIYHNVIFRPGVVYGQDTLVQRYPFAWFCTETAKSGQLPGWFPYQLCGFPIITSQPFYPQILNWLTLPVTRGITWDYIIHSFIAAVLMYWMLRRYDRSFTASIIGAASFAFSAFFISKIYAGHGGHMWTGVWIPLIFMLLDQTLKTKKAKFAALTGGAFGIALLGQHPQYFYYIVLSAMFFVIWRVIPDTIASSNKAKSILKYAGLAALVGIFAFLIAAPHLLGLAQFTALSNRGGGTNYKFASSMGTHPAQLITSVAPSFWGNPTKSNSVFGSLYWDSAMYVGVLPLILAALAFFGSRDKKATYFKILAVLSVVIALGDYTPVFKLIYHLPGFGMIRAPSKIMYLYTFAVTVLAAYGFDLLVSAYQRANQDEAERGRYGKKAVWVFVTTCGLSLVSLAGWWIAKEQILSLAKKMIFATKPNPEELVGKLGGLYNLQIESLAWLLAFATIGLLVVVGLSKRRISLKAASITIATLSILDLAMYANPLLFTVNPRAIFKTTDQKAIQVIKSDTDHFRILPMDTQSYQYAQGIFDHIENVNGYYPVSIGRYAEYIGAMHDRDAYVSVNADIKRYDSPLLGMLNVKYVLSQTPLKAANLVEVYSGKTHVYRNTNFVPRVYSIHNATQVASANDAIEVITRASFDPRKTVVIESTGSLPSTRTTKMKDNVKITEFTTNETTVTANMGSNGYLVFSEVYYPNWKVWIDGKRVPVYHANHLFRAVYLAKGSHSVRMAYESTPYRIGSILWCIGVFSIGLLLMIDRRRGKVTIEFIN